MFNGALSEDLYEYRTCHPEVILLQYVDDLMLTGTTEEACSRATGDLLILAEALAAGKDLTDVPLDNSELVWFTDGGSYVKERQRKAEAAAVEEYSCEYGSVKFYALCGFGGVLSCGLTHTAVVPLDLVKCRMQVDPQKYKGIGFRGLAKGWAPTFIGYSLQGLCKLGFYEVFKVLYSNMLAEENAYLWRTPLYLAASASAEFFADIALAPMEAAKV